MKIDSFNHGTFTGLGKSRNGGQNCENCEKFYFISPMPPCKSTSVSKHCGIEN